METKPSNVRTKALEISPKPSPESVATLLAMTQAAYPNQAMAEATAQVFLEDWGYLAQTFGLKRLQEVLTDWRRTERFFPLTGELRARLAAPPEAKTFHPAEPPCGCDFSKMDVCEHGNSTGIGALREAFEQAMDKMEIPKPVAPRTDFEPVDIEARRKELRLQAKRITGEE